MGISLNKLICALKLLSVDYTKVNDAIASLSALQDELNDVEVKGRDKVDTLLGCMMAIEAIIGEDKPNG